MNNMQLSIIVGFVMITIIMFLGFSLAAASTQIVCWSENIREAGAWVWIILSISCMMGVLAYADKKTK